MRSSAFLLSGLGLIVTMSGCMLSATPFYIETRPMGPPPVTVVAQAEPVAVSSQAVVQSDESVDAATPPPDPVPEIQPMAPATNYVWSNGHWSWYGGDWVWVDGYWMEPRVGFVYYAPRYEYVDGRVVYYHSYWAGSGGRREYVTYNPERLPPRAYRASYASSPQAWRAEHHDGWRRAPNAGTYRPEVARQHALASRNAQAHGRPSEVHGEARGEAHAQTSPTRETSAAARQPAASNNQPHPAAGSTSHPTTQIRAASVRQPAAAHKTSSVPKKKR